MEENIINLEYEGYKGEDYQEITIKCPSWLNPIVPTIQEGFKIRVFDQHGDLINEMNNLYYDGSDLEHVSFGEDSIFWSLSNPQIGEKTSLSIAFVSPIPI